MFAGEDAALHRSGSLSPSLDNVANELQGLSVEEQERQKEEWRAELARVRIFFFLSGPDKNVILIATVIGHQSPPSRTRTLLRFINVTVPPRRDRVFIQAW